MRNANCALIHAFQKMESVVGETILFSGWWAKLVGYRRLFLVSFLMAGISSSAVASPPTSHLRLWLKADNGLTLDTSNGVSAWADQSGNAYDAAQISVTNRPVQSGSLNGKPIIHFDATLGQYFYLPNVMSGATAGEMFAVVRTATTTANNGPWSFGANPWEFYSGADGTITGTFGTATAESQGVPARDILKFRVYQCCSQPGLWQSWIDGALFFENNVNTVAFNTAPLIGRNGAGYGFSGDIAEILIYDQPLSESDRADVIQYLDDKYGIFSPPSTPTGLRALQVNATQNLISWDWQQAEKQVSYVVERKTGSAGTYSQVAVVKNQTTYLDTSVSIGSEYYYRVYASNAGGSSGYSDETGVEQKMTEGGSVSSSGIKLWVMADSLVSSPVEYLTDYSGNGNDALQITAANRPTLLANAINGKPAVHFNGSLSQFIILPNLMNGATAGEIFAVLRTASTTGNTGLWYFGAGWSWYSGSDGSVQGSFGTASTQLDGIPAQNLLQFHVYEGCSQTGLFQTWIDGAPLLQNPANVVGFNPAPVIGRNYYGYYFTGDIAEILVYNRAVSDSERNGILTYLTQKYQILAAPAKPTAFEAFALNAGTALLTWNEATTNAAVSYGVWRQKDGGVWTHIATVPERTMYFDTGLVGSSSYSYKVQAITAAGASDFTSDAALNRHLAQVPMPPTTGMKLWLMADGLVTSPVAVMSDYSGNGNDAVQTTYANRPTLVTNAVNGRPAVHFNGSLGQFLQLPNVMSGATAGEVFAVLRSSTATGTAGLWYFGSNLWSWYPDSAGAVQGAFGTGTNISEGVPPQSITQFHAYQMCTQAGLYQSWFDGQRFCLTTSNAVGFVTTPRIGNNYYGYNFTGDIAEILIYNRPLNDLERRSVLQYLGIKYRLPSLDTDGDGLTDAQETALGTNPLVADTNGDGLFDGISVLLGITPTGANSLFPNPNGAPPPNPPASASGTMGITLTLPAGAVLH